MTVLLIQIFLSGHLVAEYSATVECRHMPAPQVRRVSDAVTITTLCLEAL